MKLLNIFKKQKDIEEDSKLLAAITYSIDKEGETFVDLNISSFEEDSLDALGTILAMIATAKCQLVTLEIIKSSFLKEEKQQEYLELINDIANKTESYVKSISKESYKEPYIKPSEML